jgi:hypothetical protein
MSFMAAMMDVGLMCTADWVVSLAREMFTSLMSATKEQQIGEESDSDWFASLLTSVSALALGAIGYSCSASRSYTSMLSMTMVRPAIMDAYKVVRKGVLIVVEWITGQFNQKDYVKEAKETLADMKVPLMNCMNQFYSLRDQGYFTSFVARKQDRATIDNITFLVRAKHLTRRLKTLIMTTKTDLHLWNFIKDVEETWKTVLHSQLGSIGRMEPVGIIIKGNTGCGKSHFASTVIPEMVLMRLGFVENREDARAEIYNMPTDPDQKFYDGYTGQTFAIHDDFGTQADGKDYNSFLPLVSSASQPLNMANLDDKGTMFCSPFVCLTTNQGKAQSNAIRNPEAFGRKFKNAYEFYINTAHDAQRTTLDFNGLTTDLAQCTLMSEELLVYDRYVCIRKYNPVSGVPVGANITFTQLIEELCTAYTTKRAALISNRDSRFGLTFDLGVTPTDTDNLISIQAVSQNIRQTTGVQQMGKTEFHDATDKPPERPPLPPPPQANPDLDLRVVEMCMFCNIPIADCACFDGVPPSADQLPRVPTNSISWVDAYLRKGGYSVDDQPRLVAIAHRLKQFVTVKQDDNEDESINFIADFITHLADDDDVLNMEGFVDRFSLFEQATLDLWDGELIKLCLYVRTRTPEFIGKTLNALSNTPALRFLDLIKGEPDLSLQCASAFVLAYCYFNMSTYAIDFEKSVQLNRPIQQKGIPEGNEFRFLSLRQEFCIHNHDEDVIKRLRVFMATWVYNVKAYPLQCIFKQVKDFATFGSNFWCTSEHSIMWLVIWLLCACGFYMILSKFWDLFMNAIWGSYFPEKQTKYATEAVKFGKRVYSPAVKTTKTIQQYKDPDPDFDTNIAYISFGNGDFSEVEKVVGTCLFVDDQHIITNRHGLKLAEQAGGFYIMRQQFISDAMEAHHFKDVVYTSIEPIVNYPGVNPSSSDLVLVRLPQRFAGVRKYDTRFLREKDIINDYIGWSKPITFCGKYSHQCITNYQAVLTSQAIANFSEESYAVAEIKIKDYVTRKGDCGVPYVTAAGDILGLHVGYCHIEQKAHAILVSRESIGDARRKIEEVYGETIHVEFNLPETEPQFKHKEWHSDDAGFENLGVIRDRNGKPYKQFTPYKSEYVASNLHNPNTWPDKHAPSLLDRDILIEQSQKYGFNHAENAPTVEENNYPLEYWSRIMDKRPDRSTRIFTDNEILNGAEGTAPMMRDTSAGVWSAISIQKKTLIDVDYDEEDGSKIQTWSEDFYTKEHPLYGASCADMIVQREKEGMVASREVPSLWITTLKSELVKEKKIISRKTRVFEASSLDTTVLLKKYFGAYAEWFRANHGIVLGHAIGTDKEATWKAIWQMLHRKGFTQGIDLDYEKFDSTVPPAFFVYYLTIIEMFYHDSTQEERNMRAYLMHEMQFALQLIDGNICLSKKGNKSGGLLTDCMNSTANVWGLMISFFRAYKANFGCPPSISEWTENVSCFTYGDDVIMSASDHTLAWYHGESIGEVLHDLGFRATAGDKTPLKPEPRPIAELGFLKSGFRKHGDMVLPPMPAEIAWREVNWVRRKHKDNHTVHVMMWNDALKFMAWIGHDQFSAFRVQLEMAVTESHDYDPAILNELIDYRSVLDNIWHKQISLETDAICDPIPPTIYRNFNNF